MVNNDLCNSFQLFSRCLIYLASCLVEEKVLRVPWEALSFMAAEPFIKSLKFCTILLDKIRLYSIRQKKASSIRCCIVEELACWLFESQLDRYSAFLVLLYPEKLYELIDKSDMRSKLFRQLLLR